MTFSASAFAKLSLGASALQGVGSLIAGNQAKKAYDYNAEIDMQNADAARIAGAFNVKRMEKDATTQIGDNIASFAASGVNPYTGSPVEHTIESLANAYQDIEIEKYNTAAKVRAYESAAAMSKYEGRQAKREGTFKAGVSLLQGVSTYAQKMGKI